MHRKFHLVIYIVLLTFKSKEAYWQVNDISTKEISGALIRLFDSALTYFREMRTNAVGAFTIPNTRFNRNASNE